MAIADNTHTRIVLWLKVTLPLLALAILSTLFLVAETINPDKAIPYADVDVEKILREQGITKPTFGGVTQDGVAVSVAAASVRPGQDEPRRLTGVELSAELALPDGGRIDIRSPEGIIDAKTREAILQGGAELQSSTGYRVTTERIVTALDQAMASSDGEIKATGPAGTLTAGRMELSRSPDAKRGYLLVFKDGVRLIYEPKP
jgi:lipopolysaccharide export system protein LptC